MRVSLSGEDLRQLAAVSDAPAARFKTGRKYDLAVVHLLKVGCPRELQAASENKVNAPIVVEKNRRHYGTLPTGYYPKAIVVCGEFRRGQLMAHGEVNAYGWVERGAMELQAEDAISCQELMEKLNALIQQKLYGNNKPLTGQPWPYVMCVYPFDNFMIYEFAGQKYRQGFALDPVEHDVKLVGTEVKVNENFVTASEAGIPHVQTGMRQVSNPLPLAYNQVPSRGGLKSDLVTMVIRDCSNINAVVGKMLAAIKTGAYQPLIPDFAPVNLSQN